MQCSPFQKDSELTVSDPPEQKMICAVVPSNCFATVGQSEILITITTGYYKVVSFRREVGRSSAACRVMPMEVTVSCTAALALVSWKKHLGPLKFPILTMTFESLFGFVLPEESPVVRWNVMSNPSGSSMDVRKRTWPVCP